MYQEKSCETCTHKEVCRYRRRYRAQVDKLGWAVIDRGYSYQTQKALVTEMVASGMRGLAVYCSAYNPVPLEEDDYSFKGLLMSEELKDKYPEAVIEFMARMELEASVARGDDPGPENYEEPTALATVYVDEGEDEPQSIFDDDVLNDLSEQREASRAMGRRLREDAGIGCGDVDCDQCYEDVPVCQETVDFETTEPDLCMCALCVGCRRQFGRDIFGNTEADEEQLGDSVCRGSQPWPI